jgi:PAS domain S-box-containing protein
MGLRLVLPLIGLLGVLSYLLGTYLTRPLQQLSKGADEIAVQGPGLTIPVKGKDEIARVTKSFNEMSGSLADSYRLMNENTERYRDLSANLSERDVMKSAMLSTALDAIITIDGDGIVSEYNPAAEQIFGYSYEEALGREMADLIVPEKYREAHRQGMRHWHATGEGPVLGVRLEIEAQNKQGRIFPIELAITSLDLAGRPYFTAFIRDITERKEAEKALVAARSEAESANEAKSRFLANMSHEIRTPLNAIVNLSSLLLETPLDEEQKRLALAANEGGIALSALLDCILDFSKIEAGQMKPDMQTFDLHLFIRQLNALFLPLAEKTGLIFTTYVDQHVPRWVNGDETMLRQVLLNLVGNALKFTPAGEVKVTLAPGDEGQVLFRIDDTGIGVEPDYVEHLFDEFSQADSSLTRKHGGTGLGLPISRNLVELMGGNIAYEPNAGAGSTFRFSLPLVEVQRSDLRDDPDHPDPVQLSARVLVVEDSQGNQMVAEALLTNAGCEVRLANDGEEAIRAVSEDHFDIVLMDLSMPNMDGLEATRRIRAMEGASSSVPIIALTANAFTDDREKCVDAGMNDFIAKPINKSNLLDRIFYWVSNDSATPKGQARKVDKRDGDGPELMNQEVLSSLEQETSRDLMTDIIGIFIQEAGEKMLALLGAAERRDLDAIVAEAHAIKSSASTFGAMKLQQAAHRVELLGRQGKLDEALALVGNVESVARETQNIYRKQYVGN